MVGLFQHPREGMALRAIYLLCRPLGQEAVRAASAYRVVSERLSREGCGVLRFDYHGTGDAPGEEVAQSLTDWTEDIVTAHEHLAGGDRTMVNWLGMGLGATLALSAAARVRTPPQHLVLWEPVLDGPGYVQTLIAAHREELTREFGHPWERLATLGKVTEPTVPGNVLGFEMGPELARQLMDLKEIDVSAALHKGTSIVCAVHDEHRGRVSDLPEGYRLKMHTVESRTDWMSSQALGTAIVPPDLLRVLMSTLT